MMEPVRGATEPSARMAVIRGAILNTPLFLAGLVLTILSLTGMINPGIVLTIILIIVTLLFAYQSIQSLRDLRASLVKTEGVVGRRWSKMDLFVTRSHYIAIGRQIFRLPVQDWFGLAENDRVSIMHYPHTGTVAGVEKLASGEPPKPRL